MKTVAVALFLLEVMIASLVVIATKIIGQMARM